ncbi:MAG: thiamine-phosphate kinase [Magnetococcales bacterium]|nr:thiamine-phosphate kinase [Magnetococcales bacterium]
MSNTIASLGEFALIRELFLPLQWGPQPGEFDCHIGDDAAVLTIPRTQQLLTTVDTMVEGIHFGSDIDPALLARKALRVNLSDMAAMGGVPHWYLLSLALPATTPLAWARQFADGLAEDSRHYHLSLVGGDTVASQTGSITITVTLLGLAGQQRAILRSTGQVGDRLLVSGTIGDSALGLACRLGQIAPPHDPTDLDYLTRRHDLPEPRLELSQMLQDSALLHAAIDLSDGLIADLGHLCRQSQLGAQLHVDHIPLSSAARRLYQRDGAALEPLLFGGGEDYELLLSASPGALELIQQAAQRCQVAVCEIGTLVRDSGITFCRAGQVIEPLSHTGWTHF